MLVELIVTTALGVSVLRPHDKDDLPEGPRVPRVREVRDVDVPVFDAVKKQVLPPPAVIAQQVSGPLMNEDGVILGRVR